MNVDVVAFASSVHLFYRAQSYFVEFICFIIRYSVVPCSPVHRKNLSSHVPNSDEAAV